MKIAKICLKDFRGFSHEDTIQLEGRNLLLYGENGSGKSSLYRALVEFFNRNTSAKPFRTYCNVFLSSPEMTPIDGHVTLELTDGASYAWRCLRERPWKDPNVAKDAREQLTDAANRAALLDYRALLRTNFGAANLRQRLFELSVTTLLLNSPVTVSGGRETTIGRLWQALEQAVPKPRERHTRGRVASIAAAERTFNDALKAKLPEVRQKATEFLGYFEDSDLELKLDFAGVNYNQIYRGFDNRELDFGVKLHGTPVAEWNDLLNEARLTALALSLYLAGAALANTTPPAGTTTPLRILALDDVLIGLDIAHRLPMLRIIEEKFADFQVLLLTHDRVWFDLAQLSVSSPENWTFYEMYSREIGNAIAHYDVPVLKRQNGNVPEHFIQMAKNHLANPNHDYRTAALYARAALEVKLKSYCSRQAVQVAYDLDGRNLSTDDFLDAIERRLRWQGTMALSLFHLQRIKLFRDGVLNPSAHFHPVSLAKSEVESAIRSVEALAFPKEKEDFAKKTNDLLQKVDLTPQELIDAASYLRIAFEVDLRNFLAKYGGALKFRTDWSKIELAELWESARSTMTNVNAASAAPLIADIETHSPLFLEEWKYSALSALTKANLEAAWATLRVPPPAAPQTRLAAFS